MAGIDDFVVNSVISAKFEVKTGRAAGRTSQKMSKINIKVVKK